MTPEDKARKELADKVSAVYHKYQNTVFVRSCTGSGKCKLALDLAEPDLLAGQKYDIIVPGDENIITWEREIEKWGFGCYRDQIDIYCYLSVQNKPRQGHVILDEAHTVTDRSMPYLKQKSYIYNVIGLTATEDPEKWHLMNALRLTEHNSVVYSLDQGVKDGLVTGYNIHVIKVPLEDQVKDVEIQYANKTKSFMTTERAQYDFHTARVDKAKEELKGLYEELQAARGGFDKNNQILTNPKLIIMTLEDRVAKKKAQLKSLGLFRMRAMYGFKSKTKAAAYLMQQLDSNKRLLGFCSTIQQCESLFQYTYHTETSKDDLNSFVQGKINWLGSVEALGAGVNIPELDIGVMLQVQRKDIKTLQKLGRLVRKTSNNEKIADVYIFVSEDTVDAEIWIGEALAKVDPANIKYYHIDTIKQKVLEQSQTNNKTGA